MANYNVGNIEIGAIGDTSKALDSLDKIINKLDNIDSKVNQKVTVGFKKASSSVKETSEETNKLSKSFKTAFNIGKLYVILNYMRRFASTFAKLVTYASDYQEILNKYEVSFGNLYQQNIDMTNKIAKAYGFSSSTLMDYTATFNNMLKALGNLTDETSAKISQSLTQMAIDYSSLFNQSIKSTMIAFQSVLAGSVRPIRSVSGFDVSETSIFAIYQKLGGEKTMRQLNQVEKRLLRIIALQQQMEATGAPGDFYRTAESFANLVKVLQEQLKEFGVVWGKIFLVKLKPALQYLNGFLIALNQIGEEVTKDINLQSDLNIDEEFAGLESSATDATTAVDELTQSLSLLSGDKLNILGGSTSTASNIGIDEKILGAVQDYVTQLDKVNTKAKQISEKILKWFGYERDANGELVKVNDTLERVITTISSLGEILLAIGIARLLGFTNAGLLIASGILLTIISSIDMLINGFSWKQYGLLVGGLAIAVGGIALVLGGVPALIALIIAGVIALGVLIAGNWETIKKWITQDVPTWWRTYILDPVTSFTNGIVEWWNKNVIEPIVTTLTETIPNGVKTGWNYVKEFVTKTVPDFFKNMAIDVANFFINQLNKIGKISIKGLKLGDWQVWGDINQTLWNIPSIPKLANGNVATKPTIAQFGEYANAKSNPEITSPKSIMKETFMEAIVPMVNAILKGNANVVDAIDNKDVSTYINGRKLAEETYNDYEAVAIRKGKKFNY